MLAMLKTGAAYLSIDAGAARRPHRVHAHRRRTRAVITTARLPDPAGRDTRSPVIDIDDPRIDDQPGHSAPGAVLPRMSRI